MFKSKTFTFIIALIILLMVTLYYQNISIFIFGVFWLILGKGIMYLTFKNFKSESYNIFYLFFSIYMLYAVLCNIYYVTNPSHDFFYAIDSIIFFDFSEELGDQNSFGEMTEHAFTGFVNSDWTGFAFVTGIISYFSNIFDENSLLVQKMIIVFFSAIIIPFIYQVLRLNFKHKKAFNLSLLYGIFSYSLFFSAVYLRDPLIGFIYIYIIYLFFTPKRLSNLIIILILALFAFFIRPEHGIFTLVFIGGYLYSYLKNNNFRYKFLFIIPVLGVLSFFLLQNVFFYYEVFDSTTMTYTQHSIDSAASSSLGASLLSLPWGISHLAVGLFSQTMPFPFYVGIENYGLGFLPQAWAALFWFFIWIVIIISLFNRQITISIKNEMWIVFLISILLVLSATSNADTRRIMAVFPVFFIVSMNFYSLSNKAQRRNMLVISIISYLILLAVYSFIK